jgi:hypothetical protein
VLSSPAERAPAAGRWNRSTVALLVAAGANYGASHLGATVLGIQVYELTARELDLGLLGLAMFAPVAALVLVTGAVADRRSRPAICAVSSTVQALASLGLAAYALTDPTSVAPIFLLVVVLGVARGFLGSAQRAIPADIMAPADLPWLVARRAVAVQVAGIAAPVIGGVLYAIEPALAYAAMAVAAMVSAVAMATLIDRTRQRVNVAAGAPGLRESLEGIRLIRRTPVLFGAITLDLFAVLFGGAVILLPALAEDQLGVGAPGLGLLRAAGGVGAAAVTLMLVWRPVQRRVGPALLLAVAVFGVATFALGVTTSFIVALAAMAVLQGADAISVFIRSTLVPLATPSSTRGRVSAIESVFIGASNELGAFESGVAGELIGSSAAVATGGVATVLIAGIYWRWLPALRRIDEFPVAEDPATADA